MLKARQCEFSKGSEKMNFQKKWNLFVCAAFVTVCVSCLSLTTTSRGILPHVFPMKEKQYEILGSAKGESSSFYFLWIFPVTPHHSLDEAIRLAIQQKGADNLIDVQWYTERQIWIVGTVYVVHVEGKALRYYDSILK